MKKSEYDTHCTHFCMVAAPVINQLKILLPYREFSIPRIFHLILVFHHISNISSEVMHSNLEQWHTRSILENTTSEKDKTYSLSPWQQQ